KSTDEVIIQEGNIVRHNSTGIELVKFYSSELVIKKYGVIYRGKLDPTGFSEEKEFYRCELIREETEGTS
ncbi:13049_t:CDS:2, partial [Ambispora leptoticha]